MSFSCPRASNDELRIRKKARREPVSAVATTVVAAHADTAATPSASGYTKSESAMKPIVEKLICKLRACGDNEKRVSNMLNLYGSILCLNTDMTNRVRGLQNAVMMGDVSIVRYLLDKGVRLEFYPDSDRGMAPMAMACKQGDLKIAQLLFANGANVNGVCCEKTLSPLIAAAYHGRLEIVQWLVENGADVNEPDPNHATPMMAAASRGYLRIVRVLLAAGADPTLKIRFGGTLRSQCARSGSFMVLQYLVEHEIGKFAKDGERVDVLGPAVEKQRVDMVRYILEKQEFEREHVTVSLYTAIRERNAAIAQLLILHGADFNAHDICSFKTHAYLAIEAGMFKTVELMICRGLNGTQLVSSNGDTVMHAIAQFGDVRMLALAKRAFGSNVDLNACTIRHGHTPFQLACENGNVDAVEFLLTEYPRRSLDINYSSILDNTALKLAASRGHLDIVKRLLQEGAHVETAVGASALFQAATAGHFEIVKLLCEHGAIVASSNNGGSMVRAVAANGSAAILEYLIEQGHANISHRTATGLSLLDVAVSNPDVVRVLLANGGADLERDLQTSSSALCRAALHRSLQSVKLLVESGANVNATFACIQAEQWDVKLTPLTAAALAGDLKIVKFLCENGADVELATDQNETALHLAVADGSRGIVEYLLKNHAVDLDRMTAAYWTATEISERAECTLVSGVLRVLKEYGAIPPERELMSSQDAEAWGDPPSMEYWARRRMLAAFVDGVTRQGELRGPRTAHHV